jgi:hypothetical protein
VKRRRVLDLACAAALVAGLVWATSPERPPAVPEGTCASSDHAAPPYDALFADGRLTVAAVFSQMDEDPTAWSRRSFAGMLRDRGFLERTPERFERGEVTVEVVSTAGRPDAIAAAINRALRTADIVYYNGHEHDGQLALAPPVDGHHLVVLDACWSTQRLSAKLFAPTVDVIGNSERSVTGSVSSFVALLDGIVDGRPPTWAELLAPMNELADRRARKRRVAKYPAAERYRLDVACPS